MIEMVDYVDALKYPVKDPKNFAIGFMLSLFWFLLFPLVFVFGYVVEVIRETLRRTDNLPHWFTWENWKLFFKHGVYVIAISAVYLIPPLAVSMAATSIMGSPIQVFLSGGSLNPLGLSLLFLSMIMFLVSLFLLPMAIILYAAGESIHYAFDLNEIIPRIKKAFIPYLKAYAVSIIVYIVFLAVLSLPLVNFLFGGVMFYPLLFSTRLFAKVFLEYE
ncbi:MAG: DUF4013 domain-containing protein [Nanoarchaeota archaeon]|nr:DUF4013 domain-containing protein [Nanoarchaeota archaeon]